MMKNLIFFLFIPINLFSQIDYDSVLSEGIIKTIEQNYPGFDRKVKEKPIYYNFIKYYVLHDSIDGYSELMQKSNQYISFFEDNHIWIDKKTANNSVAQYHEKEKKHIAKFDMIEGKIPYLKLSSFELEFKSEIDSLIKSNLSKILRSKRFIIDLRGNRGGDLSSIETLLAIINQDSTLKISLEIPYSVNNYLNVMNCFNMSEYKDFWTPLDSGNTNMKLELTYPRLKISGLSSKNRLNKIAIVVDTNTFSTAEVFTLLARENYKVKTYGSTTKGGFDYGAIDKIEIIKDSLYLNLPRAKLFIRGNRILYENRITPDFILNNETDYMEQVIELLKR